MRPTPLDLNNKPVRRILLKLSGEAFGGGKVGLDTTILRDYASQIKRAIDKGIQISIVVGGGNFFRGKELSDAGIDRSRGDYMGMLGTVMNCIALQDFLEQAGIQTRVQVAITMGQIAEPYIPLKAINHMNKSKVVIFGAGAGLPYFSTDTVSIQRALETHSVEVLMGKNGVDGVYSADPNKDSNATRYDKLTYSEAIEKELAVMDGAALSLAQENDINIRVFGLDGKDNVYNALVGKKIGTLVSN
jgi:uridylate kinase